MKIFPLKSCAPENNRCGSPLPFLLKLSRPVVGFVESLRLKVEGETQKSCTLDEMEVKSKLLIRIYYACPRNFCRVCAERYSGPGSKSAFHVHPVLDTFILYEVAYHIVCSFIGFTPPPTRQSIVCRGSETRSSIDAKVSRHISERKRKSNREKTAVENTYIAIA